MEQLASNYVLRLLRKNVELEKRKIQMVINSGRGSYNHAMDYLESLRTLHTNIVMINNEWDKNKEQKDPDKKYRANYNLYEAFYNDCWYFIKDLLNIYYKNWEINRNSKTEPLLQSDTNKLIFLTIFRNLFMHTYLTHKNINIEDLYNKIEIFNLNVDENFSNKELYKAFGNLNSENFFVKYKDDGIVELCLSLTEKRDLKWKNDSEHDMNIFYKKIAKKSELTSDDKVFNNFIALFTKNSIMYSEVPNKFNDLSNWISYFELSDDYALKIEIIPFMIILMKMSGIIYQYKNKN